jgi:predicted RNA-binding Zn-ribbon protein involved in translation (DUF1610 family)
MGRNPNGGGAYEGLKKKIAEYDIDVSHFLGKGANRGELHKGGKGGKYTPDQVFCKDSPVTQKTLRDYIMRYSAVAYKCAFCGSDGSWLDGRIALELDHIDGDNHNNELTNLRFLCPNCHALTDTYCGKNKRKP